MGQSKLDHAMLVIFERIAKEAEATEFYISWRKGQASPVLNVTCPGGGVIRDISNPFWSEDKYEKRLNEGARTAVAEAAIGKLFKVASPVLNDLYTLQRDEFVTLHKSIDGKCYARNVITLDETPLTQVCIYQAIKDGALVRVDP